MRQAIERIGGWRVLEALEPGRVEPEGVEAQRIAQGLGKSGSRRTLKHLPSEDVVRVAIRVGLAWFVQLLAFVHRERELLRARPAMRRIVVDRGVERVRRRVIVHACGVGEQLAHGDDVWIVAAAFQRAQALDGEPQTERIVE